MARQFVVPFVLAAACGPEPREPGIFDVPVAAAVLQPETGGPFNEPIAFVANGHHGQLIPLALKQGRFLTDDPTASFLTTNAVATGGDRVLSSVAIHAPTTSEVTLFAGDRAFGHLIRAPYITGLDRGPIEPGVSWELLDIPQGLELRDVEVKRGWTTTETWTATFDGDTWEVVGSRSGLQPTFPGLDEPFVALERRVAFTVAGSAEPGATFSLRTDSGLTEHDVGGTPLSLAMSPDHEVLAAIVQADGAAPVVAWIDPESAEVTGLLTLDEHALPGRLTWGDDGHLWVADHGSAVAWFATAGDFSAQSLATPWPTLDVDTLTTPNGTQVFVASADGHHVARFDGATGEQIDVNPTVEGSQAHFFDTPVHGLGAMTWPALTPERSDDGVRRIGRTVAISLATGDVVFAHEDDPCLVQDGAGGPRTQRDGFRSLSDFSGVDDADPGTPTLAANQYGNDHVVVNPCAGIARNEFWELVYDQSTTSWRVTGTRSGEQPDRARENARYISEDAAISFTILGGASPSRDGWTLSFSVLDGIARAAPSAQLPFPTIPVAGDPVPFFYRVGIAEPVGSFVGDGWVTNDIRPFVLVPGAAANEVARVDPQAAILDVGWR